MKSSETAFASTGISGLDQVLNGGFPRHRVYLVQGDPGVGKTTLSLQFLMDGVRNGETGLYITMSETKAELQAVARSHEWDLGSIVIYEQLVGEEELTAEDSSLFHAAEIELGPAIQRMLDEIDRVKPDRVVIDSLSEIRLLAQSTLRYRKQILALKQFFAGRNITALLLDDRTSETKDMQLQSVPHGVVELERYTPTYGTARRRLQVVKVRGLKFRAGFHDFNIITGGIVVYPRLIAAEAGQKLFHTSMASGIAELDALLGGGLDRGTSTLMMGPAGAGKSALASQYLVAAASRGEPCSVFVFEETLTTLFRRSESIGLDLKPFVTSGLMDVQQIDPAELQPGEFVQQVRDAVLERKVQLLVIDSLNGYLNALPEEKYLLLHLHELLTFLGQHGVCTVMTFAQHGLLGSHMAATIDVSYLADCVIVLRYYESQGAVSKAISVIKKRSGYHEPSIRTLKITSDGVQVGRKLKHFRGVLSGTPVIEEVSTEEGDPE